MSILADHSRPSRSGIVPWLFVAGFALVIAVNGLMMWFAIGSFSGLYSSQPRARGIHYNEVMAEQRARDALGWKVETNWEPARHSLDLTALDAAGEPIDDAIVAVELVRPAEKRPPVGVTMKPRGNGHFTGTVALPARGNWDADIVVEARGQRFAVTKRLFLR
jgi:nitrogen fixation protein FixH